MLIQLVREIPYIKGTKMYFEENSRQKYESKMNMANNLLLLPKKTGYVTELGS